MKLKLAIALALFIAFVKADVPKLPDYIHTCRADDPNLDACIVQKSLESLPQILKGDKAYGIPSFLPLRLKEMVLSSKSYVFKLLNLEMYGLDTAVLIEAKVDFKANLINAKVAIKQIRVNSTYDVSGKIMQIPLTGHGPGFFQFDEIQLASLINIGNEKRDDGYHYFQVKKIDIDYTVQHAFFHFESLFNGNKRLGDDMNKVLNENWSEFQAYLKPAMKDMMESMLLEMTKSLLDRFPAEAIYPGITF